MADRVIRALACLLALPMAAQTDWAKAVSPGAHVDTLRPIIAAEVGAITEERRIGFGQTQPPTEAPGSPVLQLWVAEARLGGPARFVFCRGRLFRLSVPITAEQAAAIIRRGRAVPGPVSAGGDLRTQGLLRLPGAVVSGGWEQPAHRYEVPASPFGAPDHAACVGR